MADPTNALSRRTTIKVPDGNELNDPRKPILDKQPTASRSRSGSGGGPAPRVTTGLSIVQVISRHLQPARPVGAAPSWLASFSAIARASWLNVLLVCIPISWALHFVWKEPTHTQDTIIFLFSFLSIIPLAKLLGFATEELSIRVGQTIGGLLNATLGNAVELIVAIIALTKCNLQIVQSSLVGSILSNLLLVLGMCFFAGGTRFAEQGFLASAAQLNSSLLTLSVIAVLLPAAFHFAIQTTSPTTSATGATNGTKTQLNSTVEGSDILKMSRGVAVILLFIYGGYLVFQLWSHAHLYNDGGEGDFKSSKYPVRKSRREKKADKEKAMNEDGRPSSSAPSPTAVTHGSVHGSTEHVDGPEGGAEASRIASAPQSDASTSQHEEEEETPSVNLGSALLLLVIDTILVAVTADWLVDSIHGLTSTGAISQEWVGLILLPIVGNAAEHVTAVTVSVKDKLTLSLGVAVGSSIQIALFVIPFLVVVAWIMDKPLTLLFDPFESVVLFLAVITVNYAVADGKSNWLEGMILMSLYLIIAVSFWFYPGVDLTQNLPILNCTMH